ncbi:MAG: M20/M25/M40 family metallo-hydrolase [Candidatus Aminicenantes bacterium]|nr:MAG: M20/M25/M40 family metallo-hydrolase [Candidatus Aminicenantes bacterium]
METFKTRVLSLLDRYAGEQLDFLLRLCKQNSYSHNKDGVDRVSAMIVEALAEILPVHEVKEEKELGNHHILKSSVRAEGKAIYLLGHMDTVFPPRHPFQECRIVDDLLIGPGTGDMKGGLVVMVYALKILHHLGLTSQLPLVMILNSDEEIGSISSREIFLKEREHARLCLGGECAGLHNEIVVSRNGKMGARVRSFGQGRHVSQGPAQKSSAILEIAHKIIALEGLNHSLPGVDINVGKVEGGLGANTVPEDATCLVDIRWHQEEQAAVQARIEAEIARPVQPGCYSEFEVMNSRPAMPETSHTPLLMQMVRQIARDLDQEVGPEHRRGTSDANFFGSFAVPTLDGWGPVCDNDHTSDEFIKIPSLKQRTGLLCLFLVEYGRQAGMIS